MTAPIGHDYAVALNSGASGHYASCVDGTVDVNMEGVHYEVPVVANDSDYAYPPRRFFLGGCVASPMLAFSTTVLK